MRGCGTIENWLAKVDRPYVIHAYVFENEKWRLHSTSAPLTYDQADAMIEPMRVGFMRVFTYRGTFCLRLGGIAPINPD